MWITGFSCFNISYNFLFSAADTGINSYIITEDYIVGDYDTDKTSQNELFDQLDDTVLDFTDSNPFGDVGSPP